MKPDEVEMYEVTPGKVFAGEYPGSWKPVLALKRLKYVVGKGVSTFIDLTTKHDRLEPYTDILPKVGPELNHRSFPVPDRDVPESDEVMIEVLETIRREERAGRTCYVHCWGGIGRTGTVIGCYFRSLKLGPEEALKEVQRLYSSGMPKVVRHPHSPQTRVQCDYVRGWGE